VKRTVYIETSIVSYLTARPSRDVVRAAHQRMTRTWWRTRHGFSLFVSELVLRELAAGDTGAAERRLAVVRPLPVLGVSDEHADLADALVRGGALPQRALVDAFHIAVAAGHGMDFLLTWNCKHIANATMRGTIETICRSAGLEPPVICTPEELAKEV
jgi:predicted nucleic acid-binding protein